MSLLKYLDRLERMHHFITSNSTGTPDEFARRLRISRRELMRGLEEMRQLGFPVRYSRSLFGYYYDEMKDEDRIKLMQLIEKIISERR